MEKMFKYKMVDTNKCKRCGEIETYKHLLWTCREAQKIWQLYSEFVSLTNQQEERVLEYENVFKIGNIANINKVKMKIIQGMIEIERPVNWSMEKVMKIAKEIRCNGTLQCQKK
jgi:hypothetical protein